MRACMSDEIYTNEKSVAVAVKLASCHCMTLSNSHKVYVPSSSAFLSAASQVRYVVTNQE